MNPQFLRNWGQVVVGVFSMATFLGVVIAAFVRNNNELINTMSGFAAGFAGGVVTFYFGSSIGSQAKDEKMQPTPPEPKP